MLTDIHKTFVFKPIILTLMMVLVCVFSKAQEGPSGLTVGQKALDFVGVDQNGNEISLYGQLEKGPVVLLFYRGAWCGYCNKQLSELEDSLAFISDKGGIVLAVTPERPESIQKTLDKTKASFKIIHDRDLTIMNRYQVTFRLEDAVLKQYKSAGIDLFEKNGDNGPNLPVPATYIIGQDGLILYAFFDPDYTKRATVGQILQNL